MPSPPTRRARVLASHVLTSSLPDVKDLARAESTTSSTATTSSSLPDVEDLARSESSATTCSSSPSTSCGECGSPSSLRVTLNHVSSSPLFTEYKTPSISTAEQYYASLRNRKLKVYYLGKLVEEPLDHPAIRPSINAMGETYALAEREPKVAAAESDLSGYRVSRFLHITTNAMDVVAQSKMQRKLGQLTGTCFQRCVGMDASNALFSITHEVDAKHKTSFHGNFQTFLKNMHKNNYVLGGAMTDGKGDRAKRPSEQDDLDVHLRVVERRVDGVVVRGVKTHQTGCVNSHYLLVMPGGVLNEKEREFAICFAVPVNAPGLSYVIGRQSCDLRAMEENADIDLGNARFGGQEAVVFFEDVFVPNSMIFMNGQTEFCGALVERFTAYHRRSYICKAGLGDVLIGAAQSIAVYNGAAKASHIKDKIVEMIHLNETIASSALAASYASTRTPSGNWLPDVLIANVCKQNVTRFPYEISRLSQDIAGGLLVTLPSYKDFDHPTNGPLLRKYLAGAGGAGQVDDRRRMLRLIENLVLGRNAVGYLCESMHGAGSPQAQRVVIGRLSNLEEKTRFAKNLAGIASGR